ncbi:hypothetical protein SMGD1_2670 [Sulfurimonas gotlandica GD1]|uniref:Uncharacterized protein n=1 Tax=Sulfurimonas gotlandica (strain DSM 19862 / JCM 16533 / GD1) TaxID=929558 RepID=H1FSS4_SULGG|nr:hypothetical protein SMGD1_2670 [Sulfurimonas gotlandica GD1]
MSWSVILASRDANITKSGIKILIIIIESEVGHSIELK